MQGSQRRKSDVQTVEKIQQKYTQALTQIEELQKSNKVHGNFIL